MQQTQGQFVVPALPLVPHWVYLRILAIVPSVGMTRLSLMLLFVIPTAGRNLKELTSITEPTYTNPNSNPATPD